MSASDLQVMTALASAKLSLIGDLAASRTTAIEEFQEVKTPDDFGTALDLMFRSESLTASIYALALKPQSKKNSPLSVVSGIKLICGSETGFVSDDGADVKEHDETHAATRGYLIKLYDMSSIEERKKMCADFITQVKTYESVHNGAVTLIYEVASLNQADKDVEDCQKRVIAAKNALKASKKSKSDAHHQAYLARCAKIPCNNGKSCGREDCWFKHPAGWSPKA